MSSMIIWMLGLGASIAALIVTAAMKLYYVHMVVAALVSILVALAAFQEGRSVANAPHRQAMLASTGFHYVGFIWSWGALALVATYLFILQWREWWQFTIAFMVLAGLCLFISSALRQDGEAEASDTTMLKIAYGLSIFFMVAGVIVMIGLLVDGKMWRFTTTAGQRPGSQDWAANNIFFFGALAVAAVSWSVFQALRQR